jgi:hypothetical protein
MRQRRGGAGVAGYISFSYTEALFDSFYPSSFALVLHP